MQKIILNMKYIYLIILLFVGSIVHSQVNCLEKLESAEKMFNEGDFVKSIEIALLIEKDDKCDFSELENENLLVLIVRNLIELDRLEELSFWYKKLFFNNTYFKPKEEIIEEDFMLHLKNHSAIPIWDVSFGVGARLTFVERLRTYSVYEQLDYFNSEYESEPEVSFGISAGFSPIPNHRLTFSSGIHAMGSERVFQGFNSDYSIYYKEEIQSFSFGLNYNYQFQLSPEIIISPSIGYQMNYFTDIEHSILTSVSEYSSNQVIENGVPLIIGVGNYEVKEMDKKNTRISLDNYINLGVDISYRFSKLSLFLNTSFQYGFKNFVVPETRYNDDKLVYKYYYVDEDYILHFLTVHAGLRYNLKYKIK